MLTYLNGLGQRARKRVAERYWDMNPFAHLLVVALLAAGPLFAQQPALAPAPTPAAVDSTQPARPAMTLADTASLAISNDTTQVTPKQQAAIRKIIPRQATIRSLMLPGLGQIYNRQYYKLPFIYGGFGAIGYYFMHYRGLALEAENGYRALLYGLPTQYITLGPESSVPDYIRYPVSLNEKVDQVIIGKGVFRSTTQAKSAYDFYRRMRDLNVILAFVLYAVSAVEANVAAHLKTFDLSDDISMHVGPTVMPMPGTGLVPGVRVALTFK